MPDQSEMPANDKLPPESILAQMGSKGLFGPQKPFDRKVLFEGFTALKDTPDGETFMIGVSNYRESDHVAGPPLIVTFTARDAGD